VDTRKLCTPHVNASSGGCSTSGNAGNWSGLALAAFGLFAMRRRKRLDDGHDGHR
jgi:MYXO-CTERM domain-containing protein